KPSTTLKQARSELNTISGLIQDKYRAYYGNAAGIGVSLVPLRDQMVGNMRPTVLLLMAGVCFMLLIACSNLANLLLAHKEERKSEIATRTAIGATRWHIISQVVIENLLLSLSGGVLGVLLLIVCLKTLSVGDYLKVAQFGGVILDLRVLAFAV